MSGHVVLDSDGLFLPKEPAYPVSGDAIARFLDDSHSSRGTRRFPLGDLLWAKVAAHGEARGMRALCEWQGRSAVLDRLAE